MVWEAQPSKLRGFAMATATDVRFIEMRIAKVVGLLTDEEQSQYVVLEEVAGDRQWNASHRSSARPPAHGMS
jgi:hypothetical protein